MLSRVLTVSKVRLLLHAVTACGHSDKNSRQGWEPAEQGLNAGCPSGVPCFADLAFRQER
jgi:hypothetical protein